MRLFLYMWRRITNRVLPTAPSDDLVTTTFQLRRRVTAPLALTRTVSRELSLRRAVVATLER